MFWFFKLIVAKVSGFDLHNVMLVKDWDEINQKRFTETPKGQQKTETEIRNGLYLFE